MVLKLKSCGRCGGDVFIEHDIDGPWLVCLQCGRATPLPNPVAQQRWPQPAGLA